MRFYVIGVGIGLLIVAFTAVGFSYGITAVERYVYGRKFKVGDCVQFSIGRKLDPWEFESTPDRVVRVGESTYLVAGNTNRFEFMKDLSIEQLREHWRGIRTIDFFSAHYYQKVPCDLMER